MVVERLVSKYLDSNTYILKEKGEAVIIDAGVDFEIVKKAVADFKVVGVLLTHGHYDHALNVKKYAKEFGVNIYASENIIATLSDVEANYGENFKIEDFSNFVLLKDETNFCLGNNFHIHAIWTPGHSHCSMSYLICLQLFSGDFLFKDGIGRMDLISSNKKEMIESLEKISKIKFEKCNPGHYDTSDFDRAIKTISTYLKYLKR